MGEMARYNFYYVMNLRTDQIDEEHNDDRGMHVRAKKLELE